DEHDESHQGESSPTWSAREVAAERARRAGAACLWLSPCPSLEALAWAPLLTPSRAEERNGWPVVDVVDRRREEPLRAGLYSPRLVDLLRRAAADHERGGGVRAVCVLNRKGRSALLACAGCAELARCERCQAAVGAGEEATLVCRHCAATRPSLCLACGSTRLKLLRPGVRRVRDDLERLVGVPVAEVTGDADAAPDLSAVPILVGTEAVLHRGLRPDVVAFLDLDAELLAPRYRAGEEALALVARAARMLGPRAAGGRLVLQTRLPGHEVVQAALHADPGRVAAAEGTRRAALHFPRSPPWPWSPARRRRTMWRGWAPRGVSRCSARLTVTGWSAPPTTGSSATPWPPSPAPRGASASPSTRSGCDGISRSARVVREKIGVAVLHRPLLTRPNSGATLEPPRSKEVSPCRRPTSRAERAVRPIRSAWPMCLLPRRPAVFQPPVQVRAASLDRSEETAELPTMGGSDP
ncbi:MAG: hypothetical protein H0V52_09305, partial [Acidimicrobiia bacterium]|nr:hypothetical protein [Acidimicrobiia bacterium]